MEPLLLGLAAPSIASTASAVGRAVAPVAKLLASPFSLLLKPYSQPSQSDASQTIQLEGLQTRAKALSKDLESRIQLAIKDSGVQLEFPVRLTLSEFDGTLEADAVAFPQREILEAALASDPTLANDFRELANYTTQTNNPLEALLVISKTDNQLHLQFE